MIVQCCVCGRIRRDAQWTIPSRHQLQNQQISHTYCPICAHKTLLEYRKTRSALNSSLTPKVTLQSV